MAFTPIYTHEQYTSARNLWLQGELSCVEIAQKTGVPVGTVYTWVSRVWRAETEGLKKSAAIDEFLRRSA